MFYWHGNQSVQNLNVEGVGRERGRSRFPGLLLVFSKQQQLPNQKKRRNSEKLKVGRIIPNVSSGFEGVSLMVLVWKEEEEFP